MTGLHSQEEHRFGGAGTSGCSSSAPCKVLDDEARQYAVECTRRMEQAYVRFQASGNPDDRQEAYLWMHRRRATLKVFSGRGVVFLEMGS